MSMFFGLSQNETGRVGLEGAVCDDYYKIRELLYEQYAVVWTVLVLHGLVIKDKHWSRKVRKIL